MRRRTEEERTDRVNRCLGIVPPPSFYLWPREEDWLEISTGGWERGVGIKSCFSCPQKEEKDCVPPLMSLARKEEGEIRFVHLGSTPSFSPILLFFERRSLLRLLLPSPGQIRGERTKDGRIHAKILVKNCEQSGNIIKFSYIPGS